MKPLHWRLCLRLLHFVPVLGIGLGFLVAHRVWGSRGGAPRASFLFQWWTLTSSSPEFDLEHLEMPSTGLHKLLFHDWFYTAVLYFSIEIV